MAEKIRPLVESGRRLAPNRQAPPRRLLSVGEGGADKIQAFYGSGQ